MSTLSSRQQKVLYALMFVVAAALLVIGIFIVGILFHQWDSSSARAMARFFHIPAARVGDATISYDEYLLQVDARQRILSGPAARAQGMPTELTPEMKELALDSLLRVKIVNEFAAQRNIQVTPIDVSRAYDGLVAQAGTSTTPEMVHDFLRDQFGWSEEEFKLHVVRPALLEDELRSALLKENPDDANLLDKMIQERYASKDVKKYLRM
jgi:hypothetical protein